MVWYCSGLLHDHPMTFSVKGRLSTINTSLSLSLYLSTTTTLLYLPTRQLSIYSELPQGGVLCFGLLTTKLHYITLHYTTLHYTSLQYTTLQYTTLHYKILDYTRLHYTILHYNTLLYTTLWYAMLHYTTLHYTTQAGLHHRIYARFPVSELQRGLIENFTK